MPFKLGYFLSDVMTHTKGTQAAFSQNNKCTKLVKRTGREREFPVSLSRKFPSSAWLSNCTRVLYIYAPPSLSSSSSSWCNELYLVPLSTDGARQPAKPWRPKAEQSGAERSSFLIRAASSKNSNTNNQASQPRGPEETGWTRTGALPWTHTCKLMKHETTHTEGTQRKIL